MYFQSSSKWFLRFKTYDTRCLHFCRLQITVFKRHVTLIKLFTFVKLIFFAIAQIYFQSFSKWFNVFKVYDTRYMHNSLYSFVDTVLATPWISKKVRLQKLSSLKSILSAVLSVLDRFLQTWIVGILPVLLHFQLQIKTDRSSHFLSTLLTRNTHLLATC